MYRAAEAELDVPPGQLVQDVTSVGQRAGEPVQLVTAKVSPARQAASANRSPGRSRLVPVRPWSNIDAIITNA
jgi:hypothetical protein